MPDRVIGRYELREKIGSSATATVWRARDRRRHRDVAVKVASPGGAELSGRGLLAAEAAAAGRLKHPNIVPLLDADVGGNEAALVFPLIDGESLARRLGRDGRLPALEAARIAAEIADALAHAHQRGVVHRDVKPGNILLGTDGRARLFDFGIAATPDSAGRELVQPGMTTGTLPYMAPEQLAGQSPDPATDVYALAAVLYEMLAGHRPYQAATTDEMAQLQQAPPPPIEGAPDSLQRVAFAGLEPDPAARPPAAVVANRLRRWMAGTPDADTVAVPLAPATSRLAMAPPADASGDRRRLSPVAAIAGALVIVVAVAGVSVLATAWSQPSAVASPPAVVQPTPVTPATPAPTIDQPRDGGTSAADGGSGASGGGGQDEDGKKGKGNKGGKGKGKGR